MFVFMNSDKIFSITRTVCKEEIDELAHVNNVVFVLWVQDIAKLHWAELTKENPLDDIVWVVIRHEIDYLGEAKLNDVVTIKTWVGETQGVKSVRHVEIYKEEKLIVKAKTIWCLLHKTTFKPTRITDTIKNVLLA